VTFAFVDVVASTKLFAEHGDAFVTALRALQDCVARRTRAAGGVVVKTEGDGAFLAFPTAEAAIDTLVGLQDELSHEPQDRALRLAVRAGAHTGHAVPVADDYVALAVNVAARVASTAGAGQVVVTAATQAELASPAGLCVGDFDLKDVVDPVELWRVCGGDAPLRAVPARRTNVRIPVTGFVGRDQELAELSARVAAHRMVTVLGPGGLGKTRLVSELVLQIAGGIPGGAWLVELASLTTGDQIPAAVGQVLGIQGGDVGAVAAEVRRREEVLLVLDNCEHLIDAVADLVTELQQSCPTATVLCTSREPLQVSGELVWRLPPLTETARTELFTQRASASGATVPAGSVGAVDRLCAALDGLPLAIELAATQSGSTTLEELIRIAEHGTDDLARRGDRTRLRSLDAVLAWSLDCLPAPRRASLLVLSVLPGRFDLDTATTVLAAVGACETDAVRPLARASLIDLDGESYRILDTIRHAARRHLANDPELARAARLGLRSWAQRVAAALYRVQRDYSDEPIDRLLALETALEHATDDGATDIGMLWELVRQSAAYREPSQRVIDLAQRVLLGPVPADADEDLRFACAVDVLAQAGALPVADDRLEAVCAAADERGVTFAAADLHYRLAWHYASHGDLVAARRHADAYLPYAERPAADDIDRSLVHGLRSLIAQAAGDWEEALVHAERELRDSKKSASDIDLGTSEGNLAEAFLDVGRPGEALLHAAEAVRLVPLPGPRRRFMLLQLARAQSQLGDIEAATATAREIEAELLDSGRPPERVQAELEQLREQVPALTPAQDVTP